MPRAGRSTPSGASSAPCPRKPVSKPPAPGARATRRASTKPQSSIAGRQPPGAILAAFAVLGAMRHGWRGMRRPRQRLAESWFTSLNHYRSFPDAEFRPTTQPAEEFQPNVRVARDSPGIVTRISRQSLGAGTGRAMTACGPWRRSNSFRTGAWSRPLRILPRSRGPGVLRRSGMRRGAAA